MNSVNLPHLEPYASMFLQSIVVAGPPWGTSAHIHGDVSPAHRLMWCRHNGFLLGRWRAFPSDLLSDSRKRSRDPGDLPLPEEPPPKAPYEVCCEPFGKYRATQQKWRQRGCQGGSQVLAGKQVLAGPPHPRVLGGKRVDKPGLNGPKMVSPRGGVGSPPA